MMSDEVRKRYQRGMEAFKKRDFRAAVALLEPITDGKVMESALARFYAGQGRHELGLEELKARRYESAAKHFRRAMDHNPEAGGLARFLATSYLGMRDFGRAAQAFSTALESNPTARDLRIRAAMSLW